MLSIGVDFFYRAIFIFFLVSFYAHGDDFLKSRLTFIYLRSIF